MLPTRISAPCADADLPDHYTQSFVIKIWIEEAQGDRGGPVWRGRITHVSSEDRRSFKDLGEIALFIWPYLEKIGVRPGLGWRLVLRIVRVFTHA